MEGARRQKGRTHGEEVATIPPNSGRLGRRTQWQFAEASAAGSAPHRLQQPAPRQLPQRLQDTCLACRGLDPPSRLPPTPPRPASHTLRNGGGRGEPRPRTRSLRAPPPAVPDISCSSLSPLLGGGEEDHSRPATFALLGSRRSSLRPLARAARCCLDYSPAAAAARSAQRALPPSRSAPPCSASRPRPADGAGATQGSPIAYVAAAAPAPGKGRPKGAGWAELRRRADAGIGCRAHASPFCVRVWKVRFVSDSRSPSGGISLLAFTFLF